MPECGVTDRGFVLKRMDTILEEIHADLTEGFGFDTSLQEASFLNVLITTFAGQVADLWETAQDSYYAKYPATATELNLDHAVQYGGIRRKPSKQTSYPLHCTGDDGTTVAEGAVVATDTKPEMRLYAVRGFTISRNSFNEVRIKVAAVEVGSVYSMTINGSQYSYSSSKASEHEILSGLKEAIVNADYVVSVDEENLTLCIEDRVKARSNVLMLSNNLTTESVTTIANFNTESYGSITLPHGVVTKMITNVAGFTDVTNVLTPVYGRMQENDIELRQAYIAKSALRSNTMIDSICAELLNNVADIETASGYENYTDFVDARGLAPHSIEMIVEGGDNSEIAQAILKRKAGGIQTNGKIIVDVPGLYGDTIPIRFNRPEYLYTFIKVILHGNQAEIPSNYPALAKESILNDTKILKAGDDLLTQLLHKGIYQAVAGITYIDIMAAYSPDSTYVPVQEDYRNANIIVSTRQKVLVDGTRIEVSFVADNENR